MASTSVPTPMARQQSTTRYLPPRQRKHSKPRRSPRHTPSPTELRLRLELDRAVRDGLRESIASLTVRPEPRQMFDNALARRPFSYNALLAMLATNAGRVPKEDALAPLRRAIQVLELAYPESGDPVQALVAESDVDAGADPTQARALAERTPDSYLRAADATERHGLVSLETARVLRRAAHSAVVGHIGATGSTSTSTNGGTIGGDPNPLRAA